MPDFLNNPDRLTVVALLVFILWSGAKPNPLWVFGWVHRDQIKLTEMWMSMALQGTALARRAVSVLRDHPAVQAGQGDTHDQLDAGGQ